MLQPCSCRIGQEQWEVANNEIVIIRSTGLTSKTIVFEPKPRVCLSIIFRDVGRWSVPWRESSVEDVSAEGLRAWQAKARAPVLATVVASAATRMIAVAGSFSWVAVGTSTSVEGAARIVVTAETLRYLGRSALHAALQCLVD